MPDKQKQLATLEQIEQELARLEQRREKTPEAPAVQVELARACYRAAIHDPEARGAGVRLERALELDPYFSPAWFRVGLLRHRAGNHNAACDAYHKALQYSPGNPKVLYHLAHASLAVGKTKEARKAVDSLLSLRPGFPPALLARAECILRENPRKERQRIQKSFQETLQGIEPRPEWLQPLVEKLLKFLLLHGAGQAERALLDEISAPWRELTPDAAEWELLDAASLLAAEPYEKILEALPHWVEKMNGSLTLDIFLNAMAPGLGSKKTPPDELLAAREERIRDRKISPSCPS